MFVGLMQTFLSGLKTIVTSIQRFGEVVVESKPCETNFVRENEKQAQMMVADISPPDDTATLLLSLI
jgi:hypothetical protein